MAQNCQLINLDMLIALCHSTCSCSCQCLTTIMKRMKQSALFSFFVLMSVDYSLFTLSEWLICVSSYTLLTKMVCSSI